MKTQDKRLASILIFSSFFLMIPLIAMQFSTEVNWSLFDFIIAGILLFGTGLVIELILRKVKTKKNRVLLTLAILFLLLVTWTEIAVGIFGTPLAGS